MSEGLYLMATVAGRRIAIDSATVESVIDLGVVTPVPRAAAHVRGLATLRSRVVTVIDTRSALGEGPDDRPAGRAVVMPIEGHHYAFTVDSLQDIAPCALQPIASGVAMDDGWDRAGRGLIDQDGEPVLVVDLTVLVASPSV